MKQKAKSLFINVTISLIIGAVLSYFVFPVATQDYHGFWNGCLAMFHGACFVPSLIFAQFYESREVIASNSGGWYLTVWWLSAIFWGYSTFIIPLVKKN
jgi:hypothetical protein